MDVCVREHDVTLSSRPADRLGSRRARVSYSLIAGKPKIKKKTRLKENLNFKLKLKIENRNSKFTLEIEIIN